MARVSNPLIGKTSGSVGGTTFTTWKGINVLKTKPISVANPKTDKQLAQRAALSETVALYREMSDIISLGFKSLAVKMSPYNAFTSDALKNAYEFDGSDTPTFKPSGFKITKGSIAPTLMQSKEIQIAAKTVVVFYKPTADAAGQSLNDKPILFIKNVTKKWREAVVANSTRADGQVSHTFLGEVADGDEFDIYLGFVSADGSNASDSVYESETAIDE